MATQKTTKKTTKKKGAKPCAKKKGAKGRPSKLTDTVKKKIVDAVKRGTPLTAAAASAGISSSAVMQWMKLGREGKAAFSDFEGAVTRAREEAIDIYVQRIRVASDTDHRAAAWMLARLDPCNFGDPGKRQTEERERRLYDAQVMKAEADARLVSAKAFAAEAMAKRLDSGAGVLDDVVALLDENDARDIIRAAVKATERSEAENG
jgi:transposase